MSKANTTVEKTTPPFVLAIREGEKPIGIATVMDTSPDGILLFLRSLIGSLATTLPIKERAMLLSELKEIQPK